MKLRKLEQKDAKLMLEWMHDESVVHNLKADFMAKTLQDCQEFIMSAQDMTNNIHLAIVDEDDCYMGTVSLKNITNDTAELGITIRTCAMGKGYAKDAVVSIIEKGQKELGLKKIYWCVSPENKRACQFYDKNGYVRSGIPLEAQNYSTDEKTYYVWYEVLCEKRQ